jgi:hypothetical protein
MGQERIVRCLKNFVKEVLTMAMFDIGGQHGFTRGEIAGSLSSTKIRLPRDI